MDLLPSLAYACGIDLEALSMGAPKIDGLNVWGTLLGEDGFKHPRNELLHWHGRDGLHAIQLNDWKLFINGAHAQVTGHEPSEEKSPPALFNLSEDREEQIDLSEKHPQLVNRLSALAERRLKSMQAGMMKLGQANE
jgi:arylsulfatase A-like enzyme